MNEKRLLDGDPDKLRSEYLFDLAHVCHMDARQVDVLRYGDFCNYIIQIDGYWQAKRKQAEEGG